MFWIAAAILTGITCLALLASLRSTAPVVGDHDSDFYKAQIVEIDRQLSLTLIGEKEASSAKTEAARRLLAVSLPENLSLSKISGISLKTRKLAAAVTLLVVPAVALPLYGFMGSPSMPSFALADRTDRAEGGVSDQTATDPNTVDINRAVQQIEAHLLRNPDDGRGYEVVGPVYMRLGRHADAARAFETVLRLLGPTAERHFNLGEALVYEAGGTVSARASAAFSSVLALDSDHLKAQFFLALGAQQEGNFLRARTLLSSIREHVPEGDLKIEIDRQLQSLETAPKIAPSGGEGLAAFSQAQQEVAIRGMVDGLAARLAAAGGSAEDWARLVRALSVLKETGRAEAILAEARVKFADKPEQLKQIEQAFQLEIRQVQP
jgi:cytochrome c-type biogenesis protein CcmH